MPAAVPNPRTTTVNNWRDFVRLVERIVGSNRNPRTFLFRGQPEVKPLLPKLIRSLPARTHLAFALQVEKKAFDHFRSQAHLHDPAACSIVASATHRPFAWWPLMQHHSAPTRLLDWTASPYVAAYFAAEKERGKRGVVYVIDADRVDAHFKAAYNEDLPEEHELLDPDAAPGLVTVTPYLKTTRVVSQQGYFTVCVAILDDHEKRLREASALLAKWILPPVTKTSLLHHLRTMNITASSLYPGLDGLGKSTAEIANAEAELGRR